MGSHDENKLIMKFHAEHAGDDENYIVNKLMFYHPKTRCVKPVNLLPFKCIVMTSREQRFITKEHIATHTNLFL